MPERQTSPAEVSPDDVGSKYDTGQDGARPDAPSTGGTDAGDGASNVAPVTEQDPAPELGHGAEQSRAAEQGRVTPSPSPRPVPGGDTEPVATGVAEPVAPVPPAPAAPTADGTTAVIPTTAMAPAPAAPATDGATAPIAPPPAGPAADGATAVIPSTSPAPDGATEVMSHLTEAPRTPDAPPGDGSPAATALTADAPTAEASIPATDPATDTDPADAPTQVIPVAGVRPPKRRRKRTLLLTGAAVVVLLAALYVADLVLSSGTVPRGVTVAGQDVAGLTPADAEQRVRAAVEPRTMRPVAVAVGDVTSEIDPRAAGLSVDWAATIRQAGAQPLNPFTRLRTLFTHREVGVVTSADAEAVDSALQQLVPVVNRPPAEGSVRFEGVTPVPVPPVDGQELDLAGANDVLQRDWTNGTPVRLPVRVLEPTTTDDDVTKAVTDVATPAVSGPVTVDGEKVTGTISPEVIAAALSFRADPDQGLVPELNKIAVQEALDPQLASSEQPGRDASLSFVGGRPVVTPSQDGRGIDYEATLKDLLGVLVKTGDERRITAVYAAQPAELTTEELNGLGITQVIGEFTTGGFAADSGRNIRRAAQVINGRIVKPGATFSLNGATEPRNAANGYVEAGVIEDGHPSRGIGGGVSQVATTLYNAAYFAGMTDVTHKPHSFYISRYPPGREATVVGGALDMRFRNDGPTGVLIQTAWTPSSLTVRLYGTKRYDVTSSTGPRTNPTEPTKVEIPAGKPCAPSQGAPGFTVTDTRTLRDVKTGQVRTERRTTKYNPSPIVTCSSG